MPFRLGFLIASICALLGCSTTATPEWPWGDGGDPCSGICDKAKAQAAFAHSVSFCRKIQNHYERKGNFATSGKFWIGALGTLSGAVLSPISEGTAKTAWSGLSGSTNALQTSFEESFSSAIFVRRRVSVADAGKEGIRQFGLANTADEQVNAAVAMAFNCSVAAASAESAVLAAISTTQVINPTPLAAGQADAAANAAKAEAEAAARAAEAAKEAAEQAAAALSRAAPKAVAEAAAASAAASLEEAQRAADEAARAAEEAGR